MAPVRSHRSHRHGARGLGDLDISSSGSSLRSKSSTDSDDVSVKILTPVNDEWEKNYSEFDSSFPTQVKCIVWRIKDFSTLLQLKGASGKEEIEFTGGEEVSMPSKWKMSLMFDGDKIGLYLSLVEYTGTERTVFAKFESKIKHPCGTKELISRSVQPTDMKAVEDWGWGSFTSVPSIKNSGVLVRDRLTIHLRLEFYGKTATNTMLSGDRPSREMMERQARDGVINDLGTLLKTGANSDFVIKVPSLKGFASVKVHKAILAARSPVFFAMMESKMVESTSGEMTIPDLNLKSLNVLLKFIYTGIVDDTWIEYPGPIVNASEKYDLPILKSFCEKQLHGACNSRNAFELLKVAKTHNLTTATHNISEFIYLNIEEIVKNA